MEIKMLKCGDSGYTTHRNAHGELPENHPTCLAHDCCEVVEMPNLEGRMARCAYFGKTVKTGSYNGNSCDKCKDGGICSCEQISSTNLWFFKHKPDEEYDEFYCACHGAD